MKKAVLFQPNRLPSIKCTACSRYCLINSQQVGFCQSRINCQGILYSLNYGLINGWQVDPLEKKPLYHFYPGQSVLSLGSFGCNFRCRQCLNWWCSYGQPATITLQALAKNQKSNHGQWVSPKEVVRLCLSKKLPGIAFTYNEPSIWPEFVHDTARLAKKAGLFTCFISNGSWSRESLHYLGQWIDAANIDLKGYYPDTYTRMGAFYPGVLENTRLAFKKYGIHLEITTLIIPTVNDNDQELRLIARFIRTKLSPKIPWHLSRFDPDLAPDRKYASLPSTPVSTLMKAYKIGREEGLEFIYVWAPPKNAQEKLLAKGDTICPGCRQTVVKRDGWRVTSVQVKNGCCQHCGEDLYFIN
jgi:pyruvate formate lyase activating enzyme